MRSARRSERPIAWSVDDSAELYQVNAWGKGYFCVNPAGHLVVRPDMNAAREIDLFDVVQGLKERELTTPVVVRFSDILAHRLKHLHDAFAQAIAENDYQNRYTAVFPIKVNQQRLVVEEVYRYGQPFGFGLEVGSKPELLSVMTHDGRLAGAPHRLQRLQGRQLPRSGDHRHQARPHHHPGGRELQRAAGHPASIAEKYNVRPRIGVRVKLASEGSGKWRDSAGDKSKFGLFITEILEAVEILREKGMLDCLQLVHCHPGSQLQDIRRVKDAINELAHVYAELKLLGAGLQYIDVGGGLGVDYDGSGTNFSSSMNYTLNEYANDVVYRIANVCNTRKIAHPMIVSESGRAIAAHHSVLIFNTLGSSALDQFRVTGKEDQENGGALPQPVRDLLDAYPHGHRAPRGRVLPRRADRARPGAADVQPRPADARAARPGRAALLGHLRQGARPHAQARRGARRSSRSSSPSSRTSTSAISRCSSRCPTAGPSTSCSRSCPSTGSTSGPTRKGVLADITCDSDGKIDRFVSQRDVKKTLELHAITAQDEYYLAAFLVGAYQETLGDLHNLFGDTHVVHVRFHDDGGWWIEEIVKGDTANKVLEYMEYDVADLHPALARDCERAVREGRMSVAESQGIKRFYEGELNGYAYLE